MYIDKLCTKAEETVKRVEVAKRRHKARRAPLRALVKDLAVIFQEITQSSATLTTDDYDDEKPYKGRFYEFVQTYLNIIDPAEVGSNTALVQQIKAALKEPKG